MSRYGDFGRGFGMAYLLRLYVPWTRFYFPYHMLQPSNSTASQRRQPLLLLRYPQIASSWVTMARPKLLASLNYTKPFGFPEFHVIFWTYIKSHQMSPGTDYCNPPTCFRLDFSAMKFPSALLSLIACGLVVAAPLENGLVYR